MCADSAPVACARTNKCAQDKRPRQTQQKTRFDYGFKDASLPAQTTVPKATKHRTSTNPQSAGSQEFTTFQQTGSIDTGGACESAAHGQPSNAADAPPDHRRALVRQTQRNDWTERAANTRQPLRDHQTPPPRPRTAKGQRHDYHEGRIQWGSHTQCESGRRRDGVNLRRRPREPDAQRR